MNIEGSTVVVVHAEPTSWPWNASPTISPCGFFVCIGSVINVAPDTQDARMFTMTANPYPL